MTAASGWPCRPRDKGHRGGRLVVLGSSIDSIDPALADGTTSATVVAAVYDGLTGTRHTGGSAGTQLVPDLAAALPLPTDGGRSYTFHLRPGIRYSDGTPLRAEDFRRALEREFSVNGGAGPVVREGRRRRQLQAAPALRPVPRRDRERPLDADAAAVRARPAPAVRPRLAARARPRRDAAQGRGNETGPVDRRLRDPELRAGAAAHARPQPLLPRSGRLPHGRTATPTRSPTASSRTATGPCTTCSPERRTS